MHSRNATLLTILLLLSAHGQATQQLPDKVTPHFSTGCNSPYEAMGKFMKAVQRSELTLFENVVDSSMITPVRVEFLYDLRYLSPTVTIHSDLKEPAPIHGSPDFEIRSLTTVLDRGGNIVDTKANAYLRDSGD